MHSLVESAAALRQILQKRHREVDSKLHDPALARMVVIGHSQGGLLTKTTVVDSGDRLWRSLGDELMERMNIDAEARDMHHRFLFIDSPPSVIRVVFIATPRRGSFLARNWVASLFRRFASLPAHVIKDASAFLTMGNTLKLPFHLKGGIPTSTRTIEKVRRIPVENQATAGL